MILKERGLISQNQELADSEHAHLLINNGLRNAKSIPEGRLILFGFYFKDGTKFYQLSQEFIKREAIPLGKDEKR